MEEINSDGVVTMGIFAHANAGKTTLTEQLLYHTKVIDIIGKVDDGNTITDSLNIERERGISVRSSLVTFYLDNKKVQLIDTPGHIDFSAEVERSLHVLDCAILVISGVESIEPQTYTLWRQLKENKIPTFIFINKMDRKGADYHKVIGDIKMEIEKKVISLVDITTNSEGFNTREYNLEEIVEQLSELDEEVLRVYIETPDQITKEFINSKIKELVEKNEIFPIIGGSALKDEGISLLIGILKEYLPMFNVCDNRPFSAFIYLIRVDNGKRNCFAKILSGNITNRDTINMEDGSSQKVKGLYTLKGANLVSINEASAGDIVIINGIDAECNQYIGEKPDNAFNTSFVNPLINMNVVAMENSTSGELMTALNILNLEDPYLNVRFDKLNNQIVISLMGEIQAQIIQTMLKERFNIDCDFVDPILIHKEMPSKKGEGIASYTSVSAIKFEINPLPTGSGIVYQSKLSTDYLLKKYQKQAEKLVKKFLFQGVYGWEVTDAEISLIDGRFDSMGSDPMHFNIAAPLALMRALKDCNMKVVEPIAKFTIILPREYLSNVVNHLSAFNSNFEVMDENSDKLTINGEAKYSNMLNFQTILISLTSGLGVYTSYISRYEISSNQDIIKPYIGPDPRNEIVFLINDMKGSYEALDKPISKRKKESSSKFKRQKKEAEYSKKRKDNSI